MARYFISIKDNHPVPQNSHFPLVKGFCCWKAAGVGGAWHGGTCMGSSTAATRAGALHRCLTRTPQSLGLFKPNELLGY